MPGNETIRVVLVDDNEMFRKGLREVLEYSRDFTVVGETGEGEEAVELAERLRPDVILMDLLMPGMNGIDACRDIMTALPDAKVLMFSVLSDRRASNRAADAGAKGYWSKLWGRDHLLNTLREVAAGRYRSSGLSTVRRRPPLA